MNAGEPSDPNVEPSADAAHAADVASIREREAEEEFARQHSMPTRWLGWMLIASFPLQLVSGLMNGVVNLVGVIPLAFGIKVKDGSQAALRLVVSYASGSVVWIGILIWDAIHMQPLRIGSAVYFADDLKFWTFGVSPLGYLLAECVLGIVALRTRGLPFWTKALRVWVAILGLLLLIVAGISLHDGYSTRLVERQMAPEIAAGRAYVASSRPGVVSSTSFGAAKAAFAPYPQVSRVFWREPSGAVSQVYLRDPASTAPAEAGSSRKFSMWLRDSTGSWGELELELIVPDPP